RPHARATWWARVSRADAAGSGECWRSLSHDAYMFTPYHHPAMTRHGFAYTDWKNRHNRRRVTQRFFYHFQPWSHHGSTEYSLFAQSRYGAVYPAVWACGA